MPLGKAKAPKAPKEKKPKKPKKEKPPKKGKEQPPQEVELDESGQPIEPPKKKKFPILFLIISAAVIVAAAVILFVFILPKKDGEPDPSASVSVEPEPPVLPTEIPIGDDVTIKGMVLGGDESGAVAEKSKRVTYIYSNLNNAGKAAETYAGQLAQESPSFAVVDEEFVRQTEKPDYTTDEGMVLLARDVPLPKPEATAAPVVSDEPSESLDPEASAGPTPTPEPDPEPTPEPTRYVHTVRITWSPGVCVVTVDEEEGKITMPATPGGPVQVVGVWEAQEILEGMSPEELGLPGQSMDEYEIIPMDGTQRVDGNPCVCLYVYSGNNVPHTNEYMGSYLMSLDGQHLYRLDPVNNEVTELDFTLE